MGKNAAPNAGGRLDTFIEVGPGKTLSGLVKKTLKNVTICHVQDQQSLEETLETCGKKEN